MLEVVGVHFTILGGGVRLNVIGELLDFELITIFLDERLDGLV